LASTRWLIAARVGAVALAIRAGSSAVHLLHSLIGLYGDIAGFALVYLAAAYVPLPSSVIIVLAGSLVAIGRLRGALTFATLLLASVLGDATGYALARRVTDRQTWRRRAERHRSLARLERLLKRRPLLTIVWSRFTPFGGGGVNGLAGMSRLHAIRFLAADVVGNALYVTAYLSLGDLFGRAWGHAARTATIASGAALLIAAGSLAGFLLTRKRDPACGASGQLG
jgi:membrane protein DedA with SNARE-associated domain